MLSRVANNLYWMGRYIERADHLARYSKANYFSSLDAPISKIYDRSFVLESMLYMAGIFDMEQIVERDVLYRIAMDSQNTNSIINNVTFARENARGARNTISSDLWESINTYYHRVINYPQEVYLTTGLYDFNQMILDQTSIVSSKIYGTLLHDEEWAIILIGMHIERAIQIIRIINSKLNDIYKIEQSGLPIAEKSFEWANLLRCVESFDMNRKLYHNIPNRKQALEFLLLNENCPRSISYSLKGIRRYEEKISRNENADLNTINFQIRKLSEQYRYLTYDEFKDDIYGLLNRTQSKIFEIADELEKKYFSY
jgi:uncharacterized alpha-E superfamily protein